MENINELKDKLAGYEARQQELECQLDQLTKERRQSEILVQLEHSQMRMNLLMNSINLGTWDYNHITGELYWSAECRQIYGLDQDITIGFDTFQEHIFAEDKEEVLRQVNLALEPGGSGTYDITFRIIRFNDQSIRWIRSQGKVYKNSSGQSENFIGTVVDITESRLAEQALQNQRKQLYSIFMQAPVGIGIFLGPRFIVDLINPPLCKLYGLDCDDFIGKPVFEVLTHAKNLGFEELLTKVLDTGLPYRGEATPIPLVRNGLLETAYVDFIYEPFRAEDGSITGVIAIATEVTTQRKLVQMVEDSERLLRDITSATPTGLWMVNASGAFTYVNQTWADWTGRDYDSLMGTGWLQAIHDPDRNGTIKKFQENLISHTFHEIEFRYLHADGSERWAIANGKPQFSTSGAFTGFIGAFVDITQQKQLQQQKDEFIGIASHELKTPVTSIKGYAQILERMLLKKGQTADAGMMRKMDAQLNRLTALIADLLDVTKINTGKLQYNDREFDFDELVTELLEDLQRTTQNHTLICQMPKIGTIHADRERIGQVITNLVTNAIKYSPNSEQVIISTDRKDGQVTMSVKDFGIGIPEKDLEKVFEQFYRVSGERLHTFAGLGLGLYISSEIIHREGGKIWVSSHEGEGSTFYFSLPVHSGD